jgi:hypothetical protein
LSLINPNIVDMHKEEKISHRLYKLKELFYSP